MSNLDDKTALVTGARRGIGKAIAMELSKKGASVAVTDINKEDCEEVVQELKEDGIALELDVTEEEQVEEAVNKTKEELGSIDILVNNAGIAPLDDYMETEKEDWEQVLSVNLEGAYLVTKYALPQMIDQEWGRVISISSIAAVAYWAKLTHYSASKSGIIGLTKNLAGRVGKHGITVNAICPGAIQTQMLEDVTEKLGMSQEQILQHTPVNRVGKPEDIANLVGFLASPETSFITGQAITADGGYTLM
ncbi:MAG: SDR family NAD(P)-dependent oxidoreductase [Candidatus Paceibacterota bacterium]